MGTSHPAVRESTSRAFDYNPFGSLRREPSATLAKQKHCCARHSRLCVSLGRLLNLIRQARANGQADVWLKIMRSDCGEAKRKSSQWPEVYGSPTVFMRPLLIRSGLDERVDEQTILNLQRPHFHPRSRETIPRELLRASIEMPPPGPDVIFNSTMCVHWMG